MALKLRVRFVSLLQRSALLTLIVMTTSFMLFGYFSINLFLLFTANLDLVKQYGMDALMDGAALQFLQIAASALASTVFYTGFKLCERLLVEWMLQR